MERVHRTKSLTVAMSWSRGIVGTMVDLSTLTVGLTGSAELVVGEEHTAPRVGSGRVHVLATPVMINL
ncbi:MAG: hypothetical protein ACJ8FU_14445, partial [Xanthobacteraceae bacterium]